MRVLDYLSTRVPGDLDAGDQARLLVSTFVATAVSVLIVHQFLPGRGLLAVVVHSLALAVSYTLCVFVIGGALFFLIQRRHFERIEVWHLWVTSFAVYNLGYFSGIPIGDTVRSALHPDLNRSEWFHYARLIPVWAVITYIFVQAYTRRALRDELVELKRINGELDLEGETASSHHKVTLPSGKREVGFEVDRISHVSVEDHYCYVHHRQQDGWSKTDLALPLKEVLRRLPTFLLVHRSHAVNPRYLRRIERDKRAYRLVLTSEVVLPISKHRLNEVLPRLRASLRDREQRGRDAQA